jgi:RNA 2',3'-cyclic 3'-phosphodiesterase
MRGGSARLFAALDPPPETAELLAAWARGLTRGELGQRGAGMRVLEAVSLHLTLCFLGERPLAEVDALAGTVGEVAGEGCELELELGAPVWLPPRRPRALAVEAHERSGELERLQRALAAALLSPARVEHAPRRFRAHITVARLRAGVRAGGHAPLPPTPALRFTASEAVLYRSWLEPQGARYEALVRAALGP